MGKYTQYRNALSSFISSDSGQRFFNFAYSIGAAVVIWGALFKILHLPGGNMLLSIGMGTEVLMFILTAFDRPPREYKWEEVFPALDKSKNPDAKPLEGVGALQVNAGVAAPAAQGVGVQVEIKPSGNVNDASGQLMGRMEAMAKDLEDLRMNTRELNKVSETLLNSYRAITENSDQITASSTGYVDQMQALNRNIQGLNTIYEIQLKSVSSQLDAIDRVNRGIKDISDMYQATSAQSARYCAEAEKMASNMQRLNEVYEKVLTAMTINMAPAMAAHTAASPTPPTQQHQPANVQQPSAGTTLQ